MPEPLIVLYDAHCSLCRAAKERLESADKSHRLRLVGLQEPWVAEHYPALTLEALRKRMHIICPGGRVLTGAAAYREIGRVISPYSFQGMLFKLYNLITRIPGMLPIAELVYEKISANRYRFRFRWH